MKILWAKEPNLKGWVPKCAIWDGLTQCGVDTPWAVVTYLLGVGPECIWSLLAAASQLHRHLVPSILIKVLLFSPITLFPLALLTPNNNLDYLVRNISDLSEEFYKNTLKLHTSKILIRLLLTIFQSKKSRLFPECEQSLRCHQNLEACLTGLRLFADLLVDLLVRSPQRRDEPACALRLYSGACWGYVIVPIAHPCRRSHHLVRELEVKE